ncbi:IclR family transcriptional regulator [Pseudovibrio sp. Tun.PSC04-5.I4]|uniref:IclR family transcriptional regulator n=1 Tax=Pseudovibrio sp. Tun.PSC04-5.I4 TaxID=1798213 RepID=UPI00088FB3E6|nr:IclR family transcriptional regulator [Pseudovibrio sp. Tun.PSC04-5.I4]SDR48772.1 DNA-binding transcriptional regulator, IclR family [Pseudovibrio sp. Tun.PSC04-5.I4]
MTQNKAEYRAPALEKGLDILELLSGRDSAMSKKEMAESLDRSVNEIFRMLTILETRGYIFCDPSSGKYELTLKMFTLSNKYPPLARLLQIADERMEELADQTQQSCHLAVFHEGTMLVVMRHESPYKMGFSLRLSARIDVHASGSGMVLLAFSPPGRRRAILNASKANQIEITDVMSKVETVREQGYFVGASPQVNGMTNISYPVFDHRGRIEAVLTVPFLTLNSDSLHHQVVSFEDTRLAVNKTAQELTSAIGGIQPA